MKRVKHYHHLQRSSRSTACRHRAIDNVISSLNHCIDSHRIPIDVNESAIERILEQWEQHDKCRLPAYWLVAARIFELSILTAGYYVDNCEFRAAGDLLFNPRRILIYQKDCLRPLVKRRHGRLSDQLSGPENKTTNEPFPRWFRHQVATQISKPAILPYLLDCLKQSGCISQCYLETAQCRLRKASQAIGFLCSWSISNAEDLYLKMRAASPSTRRFIHHHLCLFDTTLFDTIGKEIHRLSENANHQSALIRNPARLDATSKLRRRS